MTGAFVAPPYVRFERQRGRCDIVDLRNNDRYAVGGIDASLLGRLAATGRWTPSAIDTRASIREWVQAASLARLGALRTTGAPDSDTESEPFLPVRPGFLGRSAEVRADAGPRVAILGCPWDFRMGRAGAAAGPAVIRSASQVFAHQTARGSGARHGWFSYDLGGPILDGVDIVDLGDVNAPAITDYRDLAPRMERAIAVARGLGALPIVLGGEHGITLLSLNALRDVPLAVVHVDAHDDSLDDELHHGSYLWHASRLPHVRSIHLAGLRGICRASKSRTGLARRAHVLTAADWRSGGLAAFVAAIPDYPVYVSIDIDVLDPAFAPGTRSLRGGGVDFEALLGLLCAVCARRRIVAADLVEVAPPRARHDFTPFYAVEILMSLLHLSTSGRATGRVLRAADAHGRLKPGARRLFNRPS